MALQRKGNEVIAKTLFITAALTLAAAAAVFAGGTPEAKSGKTTITYFNFSGSGGNAEFLEQMRQQFEAKNPTVGVKVETLGFNDYFTQLQTRIAAGAAGDSFELNYENFVTYAKRDILLPLDNPVKKAGFDPATLNKNALAAFKLGGIQYGLPASFSTVLLFYNKDLFDKAGVKYPDAGWTWREEQAAAEKIRALGNDIFGIFHPVSYWEFYKVVQQNGGRFLSPDGKRFTVNSPENVATLQFMVDRVLKSNVMPTEKQLAGAGDWDLFKSGRLGMIVTGIWAFPDFTKGNKFAWDVAVEPGNKTKATHFFSNGLVLNKETKQADQALSWLVFMSASKEAAQIRVDAGWELPASTYPEVLAAYTKKTPPANRQAVFGSLDYLVTPPVVEQFGEMADIINLHLQAARDGAVTPKEALDRAQKELEERIKL